VKILKDNNKRGFYQLSNCLFGGENFER